MWNAAMIATLVIFGAQTDAAASGGDPGVGIGGRQRAAVRRAGAGGAAGGAGLAVRARYARPDDVPAPWCATSCRCSSAAASCRSARTSITLLASLLPTGAVAGLDERATAVHAAGQPVRHVGLGRRAAGDVGRGGGRRGADRRRCGGGSTPASGRSRSSSCRRRWRSSRSAT